MGRTTLSGRWRIAEELLQQAGPRAPTLLEQIRDAYGRRYGLTDLNALLLGRIEQRGTEPELPGALEELLP